MTEIDLDVMALTVGGEARGEGITGQRGVAWVIRNRWEQPGWWSAPNHAIADVCRRPYQFSCWNRNDKNYLWVTHPGVKQSAEFRVFRLLCQDGLAADKAEDPTHGADHYCTKAIAPKTAWTKGREPIAKIRNHLFYKLGLDGK